jgi:Domain of unknown function (DUF1905)
VIAVSAGVRHQAPAAYHPGNALARTRFPIVRRRRCDGVLWLMTDHHFTAELWRWDARQQDTWTFVTLPQEVSAGVEDEADAQGPRAGFGSVRVEVRIGPSLWRTSLFPDKASGCFVLPVKRAVRQANGVEEGDSVEVVLRLL